MMNLPPLPVQPIANGPTPEYLAQVLRHARLRIEALEEREHAPLAVIGIGCRFPGAASPAAFWQNLLAGYDAVTEMPAERWDVAALYTAAPTPGKMNTRWGGFLEQIDEFDAHFFGISGLEARSIDPQQRLLLEVTWEAIEAAGINPHSLAGSQTGVFIGISGNDYVRLQRGTPHESTAYAGVGNALSIAANRISYVLDLHGPSMAIDTACSSSLVAVHHACQSLRRGECDQALVGGVNLMLSPAITVAFSQAGMMAADGRCKTFDAGADGYVRSEGAGVVLLKRLRDARRDGDPILALIAGSAINQDGRSNGLTAPNGLAQQAVIRQALQAAWVAPAQISYVETHGTGTALGDPIEVNALKAVLLAERSPDQPCWLGAVKANIGHLEAAAGIASLIKAVLALHHQQIPRQLHLQTLNPHIALAGSGLAIPQENQPWPVGAAPRFAGVSSFGFGGANAHLVLTEAPQVETHSATVGHTQQLFTLSAKSQPALRCLAAAYATKLATEPTLDLADLCFTANTGRAHFAHRLAVVVNDTRELQAGLAAFAAGQWAAGVMTSAAAAQQPRLAFLFTGQGAQLLTMGHQLYATQPVFQHTLQQCDAILQPLLGGSLIELLYPPDQAAGAQAAALLADTTYAQPALFALEYALAQLWLAWGIKPDFVLGHSVGELVAACVAGAFSLEEGLWLVAMRGRLMGSLGANGAMAAIFADAEAVTTYLQQSQVASQLAIAAINGTAQTVIAGARDAVLTVLAEVAAYEIESRLLPVGYAFHSGLMEPILDELAQAASQLDYQPLQLPLVSTRSGELLPVGYRFMAAEWRDHARQPVHFTQGLDQLFAQGCQLFVEIGPQPLLSALGKTYNSAPDLQWLPSLSAHQDEWATIYQSLATLYVHGARVAWSALYAGETHQRVSLPTYPFQRQRYWFSEEDFTMPYTNGHHRTAPSAPATIQPNRAIGALGRREANTLTALRALVAELLHVNADLISVDTPFVELGADSIVLTEAVRRIEKQYGLAIAMRRFFEDLSTLTALSNYIEANVVSHATNGESTLVEVQPAAAQVNHIAPQAAIPSMVAPLDTNSTPALPSATAQQLLDIIAKQLDLLGHCFLPPQAQDTQLRAPQLEETPAKFAPGGQHPVHQPTLPHVDARSGLSNPDLKRGSGDLRGVVINSHNAPQSKVIPLSEAQQQLWFLSQISDEASIAYNESVSLWLRGPINLGAMQEAVQRLVDRHEALRTRISPAGDTQEILPSLPVTFPVFDFGEVAGTLQNERVAAWFEQEGRRLLNLATGPLFHVCLLKLAADEHVLVLTAHHIIIDGWSMNVLMQELGLLYSAHCQGQSATLGPAAQFSQHIAWQVAARESTAMAAHEAYWLQRLAGDLPLLELPLDHARPPVKTYRGAVESLRLPANRTRALQQLSRQQGCTLFMTLFAAYTTLLHRLAGQEEIMIGIANTGRTFAGSEGLVGYCAHLLPIRNRLSSDQTFSDLLQDTRTILLDAYEHQDYPFARLVNKLSGARDLSLSPVVSSTFTLNKQPTLPTLAGLATTLGPRPASFVDHELSLNIIEDDGELLLDFEYNADLFEAATVKRIAGYFMTLLDGIISNPAQALLALPLLNGAERRQLLVEWNSTELAFDATLSFQQLFEAQVARTPGAVAVRFGDERVTYAQLNAQANGIAHQLRALGVGVDTVVALLCERSPAFVAAMLGIFKAGGAYLPLDVRAPAARQSQILAQSRTPLLLITQDFATASAEALAYLGAEQQPLPDVLRIEDLLAQSTATTNLPLLDAPIDPGARLAYVIYTSGSTGLPKGAMVEHRGMINHLYAKIKDLQLTAVDIIAQNAPQSFDISVWQFLSSLLLGGAVHILPESIASDPVQLLQQTAAQQITILEVVPSLLRTMVDEIAQGLAPDLASLRYMIPTGEALPPNLARQWLRYCPQIPLVNAYGPTECSDDVTLYFVYTPPDEGVVNMSIGRPILNMRMYILDANRQPVPIGVAGELYVGGVGVGRGYIHDPERTALAFVRDPFSADPHARLYKTGDKARYLPDGNIEYLGRLDYQVKLRGFRIELGEIEAVLEEHPAVRQAVVMDRTDQNNSKYLVAYLTADDQTTGVDVAGVRAFVKQRLPEYMVPALFMVLETLPLTPNGKLDRKALPIPDGDIWGASVVYAAPENALQAELVTIWADVLKLAPTTIGIQHSFFELGGHSLLAGQIISRVRTAFAVELPIRELMENPTIAGMAACIEKRQQLRSLLPFGQTPLPRAAADQSADQSHEVIEL